MHKLNRSLFLLSMTSLFAVPLLSSRAEASAGYACQVLHTFSSTNSNPLGITKGPDGNFYGMTYSGGSSSQGEIYKVTPGGAYTTLHSFLAGSNDGFSPYGPLTVGNDGTLYGTTSMGGPLHGGILFKLNTDGSNYTTIHNFTYNTGAAPRGGVILGSDGNLYGTTFLGGSGGVGTVFKVAPDGSGYAVIHNFTFDFGSGNDLEGSLTQGPDGTLYGTTNLGGSKNDGVLFKLNTNGSGFTALHNFGSSSAADAAYPIGPPIVGSDGNLYGCTPEGGSAGTGAIYRIAPDGTGYAVVYSFPNDGTQTSGTLTAGSDGNIYGDTSQGGTANQGTIYKFTTSGTYSTIYTFVGADGSSSSSGLYQDADGKFYGVGNTIYRVFQPTLAVSAPAAATAGTPFNVTVTAGDGTNSGLFTDYTGTLHFTSTDPSATLPADTLITNGAGSAPITLYAAATKTIRARDIANDAVTGTVNVPVNAAAFDHFALTAPATATAGTTFYTTLSALDAYSNAVKSFTDTIHLSSTDTTAVLPADFVLTGGAKQLIVKLQMPGTQTVTATDTNNSVAITSGSINVGTVASKYLITGPATSTVGAVNTYTITAKDNVGNTVVGYTGTVHFTTTDLSATVPGDITLVNGTGTFQIAFQTKGAQKVNANDTVSTAVKGLAATTVK